MKCTCTCTILKFFLRIIPCEMHELRYRLGRRYQRRKMMFTYILSKHYFSRHCNFITDQKFFIFYGHLGADELFIHTAIDAKVDGIISAGMGRGYQSKNVTNALALASKKGIIVVRVSRTVFGFTDIDEKIDRKNGFVAGGYLSPQKARILLSVALACKKDINEIQRIFFEY